jgi:HAD superfamily hydrolase (TIGR01490 family)
MPSLSPSQAEFVSGVLAQSPRVAVFDCDDTLWSGDSGARFFYWELDRGLLPEDTARWARARYDEYLAKRVGEEQMCGEMVTIHQGLDDAAMRQAAREFFDAEIAGRFFPEMVELTRVLRATGCQLWAVSSTNNWVVEVGAERVGIPPERVLAACVSTESGRITGNLIRVPSGEGKAVALRQVLTPPIDSVFGNSIHDLAMLELASHPYCINPTPELLATAQERRWPIYWPTGTGPKQ